MTLTKLMIGIGCSLGFVAAANATSYCIQLGGGESIELDVNGTDITGETPARDFLWVGTYAGGKAYMSLGYETDSSDAIGRPIHHIWNVGSKTGQGKAFSASGYETWEYDWAFCSNADGSTEIVFEDLGFDVLVGPEATQETE